MTNDLRILDANRRPLTGAFGARAGTGIGAVVGELAGKGVAEAIDPGRDFADVESEMSSDWAACRGASILSGESAKHAARDAWNRTGPPN